MQQTEWRRPRRAGAAARGSFAPACLVACTAALITGCSSGDDIVASMALPAAESTAAPPGSSPSKPGGPGRLVVTAHQRAYLDALRAGGILPSSDLAALSIGSYVCQGRAAGQSEQAVRDFVLPLVRGDLHDADVAAANGADGANGAASLVSPSTASQVEVTTDGYIRIASERLC